MKKVALLVVGVIIVGSLGFASFKIVDWTRSKAENVNVSENVGTVKGGNFEVAESSGTEGENSNEISSESTPKKVESSSSNVKIEAPNSTDYEESDSKSLDFSNINSFLKSYNELIEEVGYDSIKTGMYSTSLKALLYMHEVGNIIIFEYASDGEISSIDINGKSLKNKIEGVMGKYEAVIEEESGNTYIHSISSNE